VGWELLAETPMSPALNVALDEVLTARVGAGLRPPTLRFWGWAGAAVVLGSFQSVRNEVDEEAAREMGAAIVRRISGGGAMFVQPGRTITYSLTMPAALAAGVPIRDSYEPMDRWAVEVLRELGIEARHEPLNDIASPEGKIAGAAQARRSGAVLHHTTMAYEMEPGEMLRILRLGRERLSKRGTPSAAKHVSPLRRFTNLPRDAIVERLAEGFRRRFGLVEGAITPEELAEAERLLAEKYGTEGWTYDLP
jgi:lipoate---protein ligase